MVKRKIIPSRRFIPMRRPVAVRRDSVSDPRNHSQNVDNFISRMPIKRLLDEEMPQ